MPSEKNRTGIMKIRLLLLFELVWIAIVGIMFRGVVPYPDGIFADLVVMLGGFVFPITLAVLLYRSVRTLSNWVLIVVVQVALTFAYLIALLPGVQ